MLLTFTLLTYRYYIDPDRGVLNITRCVDRETLPTLSVMVYAIDGDGETSRLTGSTLVTVSITDINDNKPMFSQTQYILSYREGFQGIIDLPQVSTRYSILMYAVSNVELSAR